ncbi:MAG: hypothetical protein R3Y13_05395 [bacterium]
MKKNWKDKLPIKIMSCINVLLVTFIISKDINENKVENTQYDEGLMIEELTKEKISDLIDSNSNLSLDEKIFLYDTYIVLLENSEEIVYEQVKNFLENVDFSYGSLIGLTSGSYSKTEELIKLRYEHLTEESYSTLLHEILHGYSYTPNDKTRVSPYLNEIYNEICKVEYTKELGIKSNPTSYDQDLIIGYILAEIIDINVVKEFKFNSDFDIIKNELLNIGAELEDIEEFYNLLNDVYSCRIIARAYNALDSIYLKMFRVLDNFYKAKYEESILENIEILFLMKNTVLDNEYVSQRVDNYSKNTLYYEGKYNIVDNFIKYNESELSVEYKELFNNTPGYEEHKYLYYGYERTIDNNLSPDSQFTVFSDNFYKTVAENENLTEEEKNIIENTISFLNNYYKYLNAEDILEILKTIDIKYDIKNDASRYYENSNILTINRSEENCDRELLFGEIIQLYKSNNEDYNDYVYDLSSEMFKGEYYPYKNDNVQIDYIYEKDLHIAFFMYVLLGEEFLYEYKFNPSNINLVNRLYEEGLNEEVINELLNLLEELYVLKHKENNDQEMSKFIYKFYKFLLSKVRTDGFYSNEFENATYLTYRRIQINYTIDEEKETAKLNESIYFLEEINIFDKYEYGKNNLFNIRVRK